MASKPRRLQHEIDCLHFIVWSCWNFQNYRDLLWFCFCYYIV